MTEREPAPTSSLLSKHIRYNRATFLF